jgi:hypothetical protein
VTRWAWSGQPCPRWLAEQLEAAFADYVNSKQSNLAALFGIQPKPLTPEHLEQEIERVIRRNKKKFGARVPKMSETQWKALEVYSYVQGELRKNRKKHVTKLIEDWAANNDEKDGTAYRWYYSVYQKKSSRLRKS